MNQTERSLKSIEDHGIVAKGQAELIRHLNGERLTIREMVISKCYECCGYFADGREDCEMSDCSLYPLMPYRKSGAKYVSKKSQPMTEERKAKLVAGLQSARERKMKAVVA